MINLHTRYKQEVVPYLQDKFDIKNIHQVPFIKKITLSMGIGSYGTDKKILDSCKKILSSASASKIVVTKAKKSISNFKVREGQYVGLFTTITNQQLIHNFFDKFIYYTIPKRSNFGGFSEKNFDEKGNFSFGIPDVSIVEGVSYNDVSFERCGMNVSVTVSCVKKEHSVALFKALDFPIRSL